MAIADVAIVKYKGCASVACFQDMNDKVINLSPFVLGQTYILFVILIIHCYYPARKC